MQTRLSRHDYDRDDFEVGQRTKKNTDLYKQDYSDDNLVVPNVTNGRELDAAEFEKILNQSKTRTMKVINLDDIENTQELKKPKEDKVYDINSVLEKAKNRRKGDETPKYKVPAFTSYVAPEDVVSEVEEDVDLLSDLKGDDNTIVTPKIESETLIDTMADTDSTQTQVDDSFYSKSIKFQRKDFDEDTFKKKKNKYSMSQIIITILIVLLLVVAVVFGIIILSKVKF